MRSAEQKSGISLSFDSVDTIKGESINSRDYGFEAQSPSNGYANVRAVKKAESFRTRPTGLESAAHREIGFAPQSPHDCAQSRQFQRGSSPRVVQQDGSRAGGLSYLLRNGVQSTGKSSIKSLLLVEKMVYLFAVSMTLTITLNISDGVNKFDRSKSHKKRG
jgi:hypothetical protein